MARIASLLALLCNIALRSASALPCVVPDSGGTGGLPPAGCEYVSPDEDMMIIDGMPFGTGISIDSVLRSFVGVVAGPGGDLGGEVETYGATLYMPLVGFGGLTGFLRDVSITTSNESHSAPRVPGNPVQSFGTQMSRMQGQLAPGDPDFDLLRITAGTALGLPGPGSTTLTRLGPPGSSWNVDSFFDINYRIDYIGAPGGSLAGRSGSTTGTIRMRAGSPLPEPSAALLLAIGGALLPVLRQRRA